MRKLLLLIAFTLSLALFTPPKADAQACTAPATATGVTVEFPGCNGSTCDLTQASCAWNSQADAASFNVTITEVETNTIIKNNESHPSTTTKILFPITQGRTYRCAVVSVSACGAMAAAATDELLCEADAIIDTPTPTPVPPTPTPPPPTPTPTIEPPGSLFQTVSIIGGVAIVIIGGLLLFVL